VASHRLRSLSTQADSADDEDIQSVVRTSCAVSIASWENEEREEEHSTLPDRKFREQIAGALESQGRGSAAGGFRYHGRVADAALTTAGYGGTRSRSRSRGSEVGSPVFANLAAHITQPSWSWNHGAENVGGAGRARV
jgi:hypothetical protein